MTTPTPNQISEGKRIIAGIIRDEKRCETLKRLIVSAQTLTDADGERRSNRLAFTSNPNKLAGLVEVAKGADAETQRIAPILYDSFLMQILDPGVPGLRPLKVDFNALEQEARPYLLAPYLDYAVGGVFPRLCLKSSVPDEGRLSYIVTGGPVDEKIWNSYLPAISAWLDGDWTIAKLTASTITLQRRAPLPAAFSFDTADLKSGNLYLGLDVATRRPAYIPFSALPSGIFVAGAAGTGKSNATHILLRSIFANLHVFSDVYLVDGKDGVAFNRYKSRHPKVQVLWDEEDFWELTEKMVATMRQRNEAQRTANIDNTDKNFIALIIDEMATYTAKPSVARNSPENIKHAAFIDNLTRLAKRGRSTGLRLLITAQEPTSADIPANVRANCLTTIAFRLPVDAHATALFGQLDGLPADPRKLSRGRAVIRHGLTGEQLQVQFPVLRRAL